jgi:nitrous oxide reductase
LANESIKFLKSILDVTIRIEKRMDREEKKKDQITSGMVGGAVTVKTKETGNLDKYVNINFPKAIMLSEGEIKPEDKKIVDISERIGFDLLQIVFEDINTSDKK